MSFSVSCFQSSAHCPFPCAFLQLCSSQKGQVEHRILVKGLQSLLDTTMGSPVHDHRVTLAKQKKCFCQANVALLQHTRSGIESKGWIPDLSHPFHGQCSEQPAQPYTQTLTVGFLQPQVFSTDPNTRARLIMGLNHHSRNSEARFIDVSRHAIIQRTFLKGLLCARCQDKKCQLIKTTYKVDVNFL